MNSNGSLDKMRRCLFKTRCERGHRLRPPYVRKQAIPKPLNLVIINLDFGTDRRPVWVAGVGGGMQSLQSNDCKINKEPGSRCREDKQVKSHDFFDDT